MADAAGYAYEHRLIAAESLGRDLARSEHVHHVDLDITNNSPENLVVVSKHEHRQIHHLIEDKGVAPSDGLRQILLRRPS